MLNTLRSFSAFTTYIAQQFLLDPGDLASKVRRKLGVSPLRQVSLTEAERLEDLGEYSEAIKKAEFSVLQPLETWKNLLVRIRCRQKLDWFSAPILRSNGNDPVGGQNLKNGVLYACGNSLPYTNSGYSKRTHALLGAIAQSGFPVAAQTRLNYPAEVGEPVFKTQDIIDGVDYFRDVDGVHPATVKRYICRAASGIKERADQCLPTVLHTTTGFPNAVVVSRAADIAGLPWIYEMRGEIEKTWLSAPTRSGQQRSEKSEHYRRWREKELEAAKRANGVVVLSEIARDSLIARGVEPGKILVAPNAAEEAIFSYELSAEEAKRRAGVDPEKFTIGTVTSVVHYEGLETLIRALPLLPPTYQALIVGDGEDLNRLKQVAKDLDVSSRVCFAGRQPQDQALRWYRALDMFVVPRKDLPVCRTVTPIKPLAALALGIPVVASDLPALREVTGGHAKYFTADNPKELASAIISCRTNCEDVSKGKAWAETRTWPRIATDIVAFYQKVVGELESESM
ncbi:glycosyltransferase [Corynebacterium sp. HMSC30G07]|uniref:glycosyltransferase n=1 Tax=Corynebacterium sp. HMSC30G07 TaxID=1581072 RepID=UPI0009F20CAC|nr:glycosyltransferase [Corynebacterium sp. HMSC30G07]